MAEGKKIRKIMEKHNSANLGGTLSGGKKTIMDGGGLVREKTIEGFLTASKGKDLKEPIKRGVIVEDL